MISIIDYGVGNLGSVGNMLKKAGVNYSLISSAEEILLAEKIILPGVGAFDYGMAALRERNLEAALKEAVLSKRIPILGICLGMQILLEGSEEGDLPGLGFIKGRVKRFSFPNSELKIPHMGWNSIQVKKENLLIPVSSEEKRYYFVHSYHASCENSEDVLATCHYGHDFVAILRRENVYGVQFHPEKSHRFGFEILMNFARV